MKVKFKELEDYLLKFGYPRNELIKTDCFIIPEMTSYQYTMKNIAEFSGYDAMTYFGKKISYDKLPNLIDSSADMMKTIGLTEMIGLPLYFQICLNYQPKSKDNYLCIHQLLLMINKNILP